MTRLTGPIMDKEIWSEYLKDRSITDCAIRTKDIIYLLARQNPPEDAGTVPDEDLDTQLVIYYGDEDEPDELFSGALLSYFRRPKLAVQFEPCVQAVVKNSNGQIYFHGSGAADIEHIRPGYRLATFNVCTVGEHVYAVGSMRKVFRRDDIGQWTEMRQGIPTPKTREEADWWGFRDIDGFSEDDMYAVGGRGDVWRFDGRRWRACALPTNIFLYNVCCAPDGFVYIGGQGGTLYKGRYDTWQRLHQGYSTVPYNDIAWFQDRLYLCSDYGLYELQNDQIVRSHPYYGHMDVRDGIMLIASLTQVWVFDGQQWYTLVTPYDDD